MNKLINELNIGALTPFSVLHASDTHLCECDERDNERKNTLAQKRGTRYFPNAMELFKDLIKVANETGYPLMHTGDLIDFVSEKNLDCAKEFMDSCDCFFTAGNHEFSQYVGEAWEDADYRNQSLNHVQESFKNNIRFDSRIINGVNFVAIDNSYYLFEQWQIDGLKNEVKKGLPIILLMHNPLFEKKFYDLMMTKTECAYVTGAPDELVECYSDHRKRQQKMDAPTREMMQYIADCQQIKAIFAGHIHFDYDGYYADRIPQYITGLDTYRIFYIQ